MVPSTLLLADALPRTPHGKLDRQALLSTAREMLASAPESAPTTKAAPRTPLEEQLVAIWSNVLDRKSVGIHDNFFDVGGDSLTAMRVVSRVCAALDVALVVRTVFEHPTVAGLAGAIEIHRLVRWTGSSGSDR